MDLNALPMKTMQSPGFWIIILTTILFSACQSGSVLSKKEQGELASAMEVPALGQHFQGLVVYDPGTKEVVYEHNGDHLFTPTSNIKILTLRAALENLPDSMPLYEQLNAGRSMYLRGTGHPAFFHPDFDATLHEGQLTLMVRGFDSLFLLAPKVSPRRFGSGWAWDDYSYSYQTERSALPLFGNSLFVEWDSMRSEILIHPDYLAQYSNIRLGKGKKIEVKREEYINEFQIRVGAQSPHETRVASPYFIEPYVQTRLLEEALKQPFRQRYSAPAGRWIKQGFFPMDTVLRKMMWESDNFLAEQILLMVARELTDSLNTAAGIRATRRDSGQIRWVDGSGLSRYNLVTPNYLVGELDRIQSLIGWEGVQDYFPINGRRGTLKDRYETFDGIIYAKTGSLSNNYNLSGYLKSKSGKWYIFSYMHNHFIGEADELDEDIERVLYYLHSKL